MKLAKFQVLILSTFRNPICIKKQHGKQTLPVHVRHGYHLRFSIIQNIRETLVPFNMIIYNTTRMFDSHQPQKNCGICIRWIQMSKHSNCGYWIQIEMLDTLPDSRNWIKHGTHGIKAHASSSSDLSKQNAHPNHMQGFGSSFNAYMRKTKQIYKHCGYRGPYTELHGSF